jgi:hypothetical protein
MTAITDGSETNEFHDICSLTIAAARRILETGADPSTKASPNVNHFVYPHFSTKGAPTPGLWLTG